MFRFASPRKYGVRIPPPSGDLSGVILNLWMNDTGSSITDYSGNGYHGQIDGTPIKGVSMGNGNNGIQLTALGDGISLSSATLAPVINTIRTSSFSQSIVIRNMGWSGAHTPCVFIIWNNAAAGHSVDLFVDYVPSSSGTWIHRAGWGYLGFNEGQNSSSYSPSSFDSETFVLTYVWDRPSKTKKLYRNAVLVNSTVVAGDTVDTASASRVQIGGHLDYPSSYQVYAKLSDLVIWNRALSDLDVARLYSQKGRVNPT